MINILDQSLSIVLLHLRLLYLFRSLDLIVTLMIKTVKRDLEFNDIKNYQVFEVFIERWITVNVCIWQNDRQQYEQRVQTERERTEKAMKEARDKSQLEDEIRRLQGQLNNTSVCSCWYMYS